MPKYGPEYTRYMQLVIANMITFFANIEHISSHMSVKYHFNSLVMASEIWFLLELSFQFSNWCRTVEIAIILFNFRHISLLVGFIPTKISFETISK